MFSSIQPSIHPERSRVEDPTTKSVATRSLRGAPLIAFLASRRDSSLSFPFSLLLSSPDLPSACCDCTDRGFSYFLTCTPFEWLANSDFEAKEGEGTREKKEEEDGTGVGAWGTTVYSCDGIPGTHKRGGMSLKLYLVYYSQGAYVVCSHQCEGLVFGGMDKAFTCTDRQREREIFSASLDV